MATFLEDKDRNVIPRLRSFETTRALGELDPAGLPKQIAIEDPDSLANKARAWNERRTISFAADFVSAAFVLQRPAQAKDAAEFLLTNDSQVPTAAKQVARKTLGTGNRGAEHQIVPDVSLPHSDQIFERIRDMRGRLEDEPRNAILWVELARAYALLGLEDKAERAMDVAVGLGPTNRFVLRSAARLYIHVGRKGKAHHILERAESTKYDPWLLSAEIAAASAAGRNSRFVRSGERILEDQSIPVFQKNELGSAIATLELAHGKIKRARNLFRDALSAPTENTVAQADWALRHKHMDALDVEIEKVRFATPRSFEASAWGHFSDSKWRPALKVSLNWLRDQSFSTRPVLFASYIAACVLEDYRECERIVEVGLRANPNEPILLNNLAFSLASSGQIEKAEKVFQRIKPANIRDDNELVAITATQGLLLFRRGYADEGRLFYRQAIAAAKKHGFKKSVAVGSIYLAREEARLNTDEARRSIEVAFDEAQKVKEPDIPELLKRNLTRDAEPNSIDIRRSGSVKDFV